jgi:hypothetical protein
MTDVLICECGQPKGAHNYVANLESMRPGCVATGCAEYRARPVSPEAAPPRATTMTERRLPPPMTTRERLTELLTTYVQSVGKYQREKSHRTEEAIRVLEAAVDAARAALDAELDAICRDAEAVTRFEVIDHRAPGTPGPRGRVYVSYDCAVELSYQDDRRTLKVFVNDRSGGQDA